MAIHSYILFVKSFVLIFSKQKLWLWICKSKFFERNELWLWICKSKIMNETKLTQVNESH
jgi:hypothetical protein